MLHNTKSAVFEEENKHVGLLWKDMGSLSADCISSSWENPFAGSRRGLNTQVWQSYVWLQRIHISLPPPPGRRVFGGQSWRSALYIASSFSALILMAGAAAATLLIMFNFRTLSTAKSFSGGVSFIFLLVWSLKERKNISNSKNIQSLIFFYKIWLKECLMFIKVYWYRPGHMTIHERRRKCTHWNSLILRCLALLLSSWLVSLLASHLVLARDTRLCQLQQVSVIRQTQTNE